MSKEQPEALRLAAQLEDTESARLHLLPYAAAELRRLHDELKECQDQRRAAFRRIEELDRELDAMRSQIGQGVPDGVLDALDNFEKKERSPFQAYLAAGLVNELRTALLASALPAPQQKPLTDERAESSVDYWQQRGYLGNSDEWREACRLFRVRCSTEDIERMAKLRTYIEDGLLLVLTPAAPQQKPLTDEQIEAIYTQETGSLIDDSPWALVDFVRAIEAAHGIGGGHPAVQHLPADDTEGGAV